MFEGEVFFRDDSEFCLTVPLTAVHRKPEHLFEGILRLAMVFSLFVGHRCKAHAGNSYGVP